MSKSKLVVWMKKESSSLRREAYSNLQQGGNRQTARLYYRISNGLDAYIDIYKNEILPEYSDAPVLGEETLKKLKAA